MLCHLVCEGLMLVAATRYGRCRGVIAADVHRSIGVLVIKTLISLCEQPYEKINNYLKNKLLFVFISVGK